MTFWHSLVSLRAHLAHFPSPVMVTLSPAARVLTFAAAGRFTEGGGFLMDGFLRQLAEELLEGHQAGGAAEDVVTNIGLDTDHQLIKDLEGFGLVLDERVALAVGTQADAVAQTVHAVEVFLPQPVNRAENGVALDGLELLRIFKADLQFIRLAHLFRDEVAQRELRGTQ